MSLQRWSETIVAQKGAATAVTGTTVASMFAAQTDSNIVIPSGIFDSVGKTLRITCIGTISLNSHATPGTLGFAVKFGSIYVANDATPASSMNFIVSAAKTLVPYWLEILLTQTIVGAGTTSKFMWAMRCASEALIAGVAPATGGITTLVQPAATLAVGNGFDGTAAQILDITVKMSSTNAAPSIVQQLCIAELLN